MNRRSIRDALTLVTIAAVAVRVLLAVGGGVLAAPHNWGLDGWSELIAERGAASAAMTLLRYAALALSAYLVVLGVLTLIVRLLHVQWLDTLLWFATPRVLRPFLGIVSVATFAAPHAAGAAEPAGRADDAGRTPVMVLVGSAAASAASSPTSTVPSPPPTMRRVGPATTRAPVPTIAPTTTVITTTTATQPPRATTWTIKRGEHLWFVAETALTEQLGRAPSTAETTGYWQRLIDANRDRLVDPANPDLVFTGQELLLPTR